MRYQVIIEGEASGETGHLERDLDLAMERLLDVGVEDPGLGVALAKGEVEISLIVGAANLAAAVEAGSASIREAFGRHYPIVWHTAQARRLDTPARVTR